MDKGLLFIISGPAGSGKGTVVKSILKKHPEIKLSISMTTRQPRPIETPNVDYYFVTKEFFQDKIENNEMLEYADYNGNYYGTLKSEVFDSLENGRDVILEIEVDGAMQVKAANPEAITIMLTPPDSQTLESRLRGRGTETEENILKRLNKAKIEITFLPKYDYSVINEDGGADACADLIYSIMQAEHSKTVHTKSIIKKFE
ncbi:MAG: guanylate kinase [Ruminococcaceae bacterium]|nr:guanylate kinase [Oscillospiraceae bacterium]